MIIERAAAKKTLAVVLALALFAPSHGWSQTRVAAPAANLGVAGSVGGVVSAPGGVSAVITLPNLSLTSVQAPALSALVASPLPSAPAASASAAAAVQPHPVAVALGAIADRGALPQSMSTREDAAKMLATAAAMPEGSAKQDMIRMANMVAAAANGGPTSSQLGKVYDAAEARAEGPAVEAPVSGWRRALAKLLPATLAARVARKSDAPPAPPAQAANREDYAVPLSELRYAPSAKQIPESTAKIAAVDKQVVGQDQALKAIRFGLEMPGRHYNLFVAGPEGSGRETAVRHLLPEVAAKMATPGDRVAATNFRDKSKPAILELPAGNGPAFVKAVRKFVSTMKQVLPQALNSGQVGQMKQELVGQVQAAQQEREAAFNAEIEAISLSNGFGVEFFAKQAGEGRMTIGLKVTREGKAIDPKKAEALIESGAFTREQWEQANKERDAKFPEVMAKFQALMEQGNKEMEAVQTQIAQIEKQAVGQIVAGIGAPLMALVSPEKKVSAAMQAAQEEFEQWQQGLLQRFTEVKSGDFGAVLAQTNQGFRPIMTYKGEPMISPEVAAKIKADGIDDAGVQSALERVNAQVKPLMLEFQAKSTELMAKMQKLSQSEPKTVVSPEAARAMAYVKSLLGFSAENHEIFMGNLSAGGADGVKEAPGQKQLDAQDFFEVSVLSSNGGKTGAPVVWVKNPTLEKVMGKADDNRRTMIIPGVGMVKGGAPGGPTLEPGAIHAAEGGFLVMDFMSVLRAPGLYQALVAAAASGEAEIVEGGLRGLALGSGESYHVPSKVKIVLIGSPMLRMLVERQDPDFAANFQASADFNSRVNISEDAVAGYVQFFKKAVLSIAAELKQSVVDLSQEAMSALVEQGARFADSNKKLTAQFGAMYGVIREATYWAQKAGRSEVRREDVDKALAEKLDRDEVHRRDLLQVYKDNVFVVETAGKKVGQINGLAVMGTFGVPMRITVVPSAAAGAGGIISVDRNAGPNQTGSSFNKALGVVEGFLQNLFAQKTPFPARLSISYEQNYGGIDGDSATTTEMYAILSALSGVPIGQNYAVTGSADQFGNVQAIGGANHKIEGYFELAKARGLTGDQGIIIPKANVADLQLSQEVVDAVRAGKFHIYAVGHVSEGLEILTGVAYSEIVAKARVNLASMGKSMKDAAK